MLKGCLEHSYVLMTNHVHLLVTPTTSGAIGRLMQSLGRRYVRYINDPYRPDRHALRGSLRPAWSKTATT